MDIGYSIRPFKESDMDDFRSLLKDYWSEKHIFLQSEKLFRWQYRGYGDGEQVHFLVLLHNERMIGFRGQIPIQLRYLRKEQEEIVPAVVSAVYMVIPEYRGKRLGVALQQYMLEHSHNYFAIASNLKTSAPIYKKSGSSMLEEMYRYLLPIDKCYTNLILQTEHPTSIQYFSYDEAKEDPITFSPSLLEKMWQRSINGKQVISLNRNAEYWNWRYLQSPIYKYHFFGGEGKGGIIVGRICDLYNEDNTMKNEKIFRILEIIPENQLVWDGLYDEPLTRLLKGVISWSKALSCVGAEFYTSTLHFDAIMSNIGFQEVNYRRNNSQIEIVSYFEPCDANAHRLSNVTFHLENPLPDFDFNNSYFTLSDADQDRPNIINR